MMNMRKTAKLFGGIAGGLFLGFSLAGQTAAQVGPTFDSATFLGGGGDQRGTGIAIRGGHIYLSGDDDTNGQSLAVDYDLPPDSAPLWQAPWPGPGGQHLWEAFYGVAATPEGVYLAGNSYTQTVDGVGGKEGKSILVKFPLDGPSGPDVGGAEWVAKPHFYPYQGVEVLTDVESNEEGGVRFLYVAGFAQHCGWWGTYVLAKYDTAGNLLSTHTDPLATCPYSGSSANALTILNDRIYVVGVDNHDQQKTRAVLMQFDTSLGRLWRAHDTSLTGQFWGVTALGNAVYAVGSTADSDDFFIQKYDESGALLWTHTSGGEGVDVLTDAVAVGGRLFAVGYTSSEGAGGTDAVILEIDPATGNTLSTTFFGDALDDKANGVATDGTDLYVIGESRSFAEGQNSVGQNDLMLLRYTLAPADQPPTANAGTDQSIRVGDAATLDGSASYDDNTNSEDLVYSWNFSSLPSGSEATLADADTPFPSFVADAIGTYVVTLVVDDGHALSEPDQVAISSDNLAPTALAAGNQLVIAGTALQLDGTGSSDPESDSLTFDWSILSAPSGSTAAIDNPTLAITYMVPDLEGIYVIELAVSDAIGPGIPDSIEITATSAEGFAEDRIVLTSDLVLNLQSDQVSSKGNQTAFVNFLKEAVAAIQKGNVDKAIEKLHKSVDRTDGCETNGIADGAGPGRDWIIDCDAQASGLARLREALDALAP